jgi:hypothetical protein
MTSPRSAALWAAAAAILWVHALLGIPGDYLGQGYPLSPWLKVSPAALALAAFMAVAVWSLSPRR